MLQNAGFEADWSEEKSHRCLVFAPDGTFIEERQITNIHTPPDWLTWFVHQPGEWDQPEVRDAWAHHDPRRARSGQKGMLLFTYYRKHDAGFLQQVQVASGTTLRLSAWAHAWSNHFGKYEGQNINDNPWYSMGVHFAPRDGPDGQYDGSQNYYLEGETQDGNIRNFTFWVGIDPTGGTNPLADTVVWSQGAHVYNEYYPDPLPAVEVEAQAETVTVFLRSRTQWPFEHNDAYWDDVELTEVEPPEPPPPPPPGGECRITILMPHFIQISDNLRQISSLTSDTADIIDAMVAEIGEVEPPPPPPPPPPEDPPPWAGMEPISLHVQQPVSVDGYGDLEFVRDVQPAGYKIVGHMEQLQLVKAISPKTVTIYRQFVDNQDEYIDMPDGPRRFLLTFLDSLNALRDSVDLVEGLNEIWVPSELTRLSDWYCHYAEALAAEGSPAGPAVGSVPVGNPLLVSEGGRSQIEEMLPMVRAAIKYSGAVNYHGYHRVHNGVVDPPWNVNWLCYAGRCLEDWDIVFREHNLYPNYIISESGAFLNALAGWKYDDVFNGDWGAYGQSLLELRERINTWNEANNYRCICYNLFTYAPPEYWPHYNLHGYARSLAELLAGG